MASAPLPDLSALRRGGAATSPHVERPPSRFLTRIGVPAAIILAALALLAYAARESFRPTLAVSVAPAVPVLGAGAQATGSGDATAGETVQAPGWIEADPSAFGVAALEEGVVRGLGVLDGDRVEAGQVVAVLIDDDAKIALRHAQSEVARTEAAVAEAKAAAENARADVRTQEALMEEARDAYARVEGVTGKGLLAEGEISARRLRLSSATAAVAAARAAVETAAAAVAKAEAERETVKVAVDRAALTLSRMTVTAPRAGVVLQRLVEPGQRLMRDANNPHAGVVVRLYDPAKLQVRIDVPLADAAKVRQGDAVEVSTEALPGRVFKGTVTRFVHEANLTKNTVQVKASITDPAPELKPDMLAKARIVTRGAPQSAGGVSGPAAGEQGALLVPREALLEVSDSAAWVWVLQRESSTVERRSVKVAGITVQGATVTEGLRPGDRVVLNPPADLKDGAKVRAGEGASR